MYAVRRWGGEEPKVKEKRPAKAAQPWNNTELKYEESSLDILTSSSFKNVKVELQLVPDQTASISKSQSLFSLSTRGGFTYEEEIDNTEFNSL